MFKIKNPLKTRRDGKPECFGGYEEDNRICTVECPNPVMCYVETKDEDKRVDSRGFKNAEGRRLCFGELYSSTSYECNNACDDAYDCEKMVEFKAGRYNPSYTPSRIGTNTVPSTSYQSPFSRYPSTTVQQSTPTGTGIRSDALNILQPKMIQQTRLDEQTKRYVENKYGVPLHPDPVIPGQFEGEEWYIRFIKEVVKYAGYYALQLLSNVLISSWWAPKKDEVR
jgi:hypothetical protein